MFYACIPAYLTIMLTIFYLIARNRKDLKRTAFIQAILTVLVIVVAAMGFLSPAGEWEYTVWIMVGLSLCLIGDILNINMTKEWIRYAAIAVFMVGLPGLCHCFRPLQRLSTRRLVYRCRLPGYLWFAGPSLLEGPG